MLQTWRILHLHLNRLNCPYLSFSCLIKLRAKSWWRHQMETVSALLAFCAGNSPVTGEFPTKRPVTQSFDVLFDLCLNKRLNKQSWGWWFETPLHPLWRYRNDQTVLLCDNVVYKKEELNNTYPIFQGYRLCITPLMVTEIYGIHYAKASTKQLTP